MSGRAAGEELVMLFNSDSWANYWYRFTPNGWSAVTWDWVNYIRFDAWFNAYWMSVQAFVNNLATFPKTCNFQSSEFSWTTLSNVCQWWWVWNNTSDSITSILIKTPSAVSLSAGTRMIIYGSKD
jgi:hypothetical protein